MFEMYASYYTSWQIRNRMLRQIVRCICLKCLWNEKFVILIMISLQRTLKTTEHPLQFFSYLSLSTRYWGWFDMQITQRCITSDVSTVYFINYHDCAPIFDQNWVSRNSATQNIGDFPKLFNKVSCSCNCTFQNSFNMQCDITRLMCIVV